MGLSKASSPSGSNDPQRTCLLTYSAIDPEIFPTRQSFGEACAEASGDCVDYSTICKKHHTTNGEHYHASFKLTKLWRWSAPKKNLMSQYNAILNFREPDKNNCMYIGAYRYITKEDKEVFHSLGHLALERIKTSHTLQGFQAYVQKRKSMSNPKLNEAAKKPKQLQSKKPRMMTNLEFCDLVIKLAAAESCVAGCNGQWHKCATEVLHKNAIHPAAFTSVLQKLFLEGRGKYRNILITGPANCGKIFILSPVSKVFKDTLISPSSTKYAWIGDDEAEIIFLNDYRYSPEQISWDDLLQLLEGATVDLPAPMNHYSKDMCGKRCPHTRNQHWTHL